MAQFVEGDWKTFRFRMIQPSDHSRVLAHLRENFYKDEPLCSSYGVDDEMADDFDMLVSESFSHNLGFLAEDKETGKIAGLRITTVCHKGDHEDFPPFKSPRSGPVVAILVTLTEQAKIFENFPNVDKYADFFMVSVDREFRGHGLANEIYDRAFNMLIGLKFQLIKCLFTSPITQRIARKRGFKELCHMKFIDATDEHGVKLFPNANEDQRAIMMVKELN